MSAGRHGGSLVDMAAAARSPGNLPAEVTTFVGRRRELATLRARLSSARIVTLVGPGGVGKTRLAVRGATDLARGFRDGAWMISLGDVREPSSVGPAAVAALGLHDQAPAGTAPLLLGFVADKELLLVVDNCEHVLQEAARLVTAIVETAPGIRVIVTSREPLSVRGEHLVPIPPLDLPADDDASPLHQLRQNEAVRLFCERASAASSAFELTDANRAAVVGLCRRLDGLPLALELAAVRTRLLTAEQILDHLDDRFGLLTGGTRVALARHQTLRTTLDWSHDLLSPDEQTLLRRLSVFAGRFTLDDAEAVCAPDDASPGRALDLLASLVDKSLITKADVGAVACYRLHETMREYAGIKLRDAGEDDDVAELLISYIVARCMREAVDARLRLVASLGWLDLEIDNIRAVLDRCVARADHRGLELVGWLTWYWITRATTEGVRRLDQFLPLDPGESGIHAGAHFLRGFLAVLQADLVAARPALERAATLARRNGQLRLLAESLSMASVAANLAGDRASGHLFLEQAESVEEDLDDVPAALAVLQARALDGFSAGDLEQFQSSSVAVERISRQAGDLYALEVSLMNLGFASLGAGDPAAAGPHLADALRIAAQIDDRVAQFHLVGGLGCGAAAVGEPRLAAQLFGACERLRVETGADANVILTAVMTGAKEEVRAVLGSTVFEGECAAGALLNRDSAVRLALGEPVDHHPAAEEDRHAPLAKREREVTRLVAQGLTNRQIGTRLFISERTVENHVRNAMNKLGFNSRAQIASWMGTSDL